MRRARPHPARHTKKAAKKAPAKKTQKKAPAKKTQKKASAKTQKKASAKKTTSTRAAQPARPAPRAELLTTSSDVQARMMALRGEGLTIGFVPTMGALHSGHGALLEEARRRADVVVVSIFVNPKQFGPKEDLSRYPRPLEKDLELCRRCGVDYVFAPGVEEIYPPDFDTTLRAGALATDLEGAARPGHFDGVLTVVNILFDIVQPHFAVFGEKDYQQLLLVRRMVQDLKVPIEIVAMPVIRDVDGLALSSRNAYLSPEDRERATCVSRALMAAQDEVQRGVRAAGQIAAAARAVIEATPGTELAYAEVRHPRSLKPLTELTGPGRLLLAVRLGGVRLIDNGPLFPDVRFER